ncbi:MAG: molybdopterin guanine dinucleotide synthesis [Pseudomonadota bacterium]
MNLFDTHIVVDWSARSTPSPARGVADAIWWAVARAGDVAAPVYARTRHAAITMLADLLAAESAAGRRVLIGFDFPFGYPEGVAARLTGEARAFALWDWLAARVQDAPDNGNRRFAVAAEINAAYDGLGPAWGRPAAWNYPGVPVSRRDRYGSDHPPERRRADARAAGAKTVWQLAYAGAVGSQVLLGLPALNRVRSDPRLVDRIAVWPLDGGLRVPDAQIVVAEVYPSLLRPQIRDRRVMGEVLDAAQVRVTALALARLDATGGLARLFDGPGDLTERDRHIVGTEEAWILGLGAEAALAAALDTNAEALSHAS